jgi:hypothetical protein
VNSKRFLNLSGTRIAKNNATGYAINKHITDVENAKINEFNIARKYNELRTCA